VNNFEPQGWLVSYIPKYSAAYTWFKLTAQQLLLMVTQTGYTQTWCVVMAVTLQSEQCVNYYEIEQRCPDTW